MGTLYYGDNLDILRRCLKDESVDLVYLDPPFNSAQNYNAFFHEKDGTDAASQIHAFEDTWHWDIETKKAYDAVTEQPGKVSDVMQAFYTFLGGNDMMAYLTMMSSRLVELRRVLKSTGSLYLHCDPTASHYLKLLCDSIMGKENFRNEIIWPRTNAHNIASNHFSRVHDTIFFYSKTEDYLWNHQYAEFSPQQLDRYFPDPETGRLCTGQDLTMTGNPERNFEWRGTTPAPNRGWGLSLEELEKLWAQGLILKKKDGTPRLDGRKVFLDEKKGKPVIDVWTDIERIGNTSTERLGYPTQKPVALLERIILASTNPGGLVLDPFCGCGTTIDAAEKNGRDWIGIDVTQLAISLIKNRLQDTYGSRLKFVSGTAPHSSPSPPQKEERAGERRPMVSESAIRNPQSAVDQSLVTSAATEMGSRTSTVRIIGEPTTPNEAATLAEDDKYQFQLWRSASSARGPSSRRKARTTALTAKSFSATTPKPPNRSKSSFKSKAARPA